MITQKQILAISVSSAKSLKVDVSLEFRLVCDQAQVECFKDFVHSWNLGPCISLSAYTSVLLVDMCSAALSNVLWPLRLECILLFHSGECTSWWLVSSPIQFLGLAFYQWQFLKHMIQLLSLDGVNCVTVGVFMNGCSIIVLWKHIGRPKEKV